MQLPQLMKTKHLFSLTLVALSGLFLVSALGQGGTGSRGQRQQDFTGFDVLGGNFTPQSIQSQGKVGYGTGSGCAVTQITNRTTGVTCQGVSGAITTDTTSLAAEGTAKFTVTDGQVEVGDVVVVSIRSGSNSGGTIVAITTVAAGSFQIAVQDNNVASGTAETGAIIINFAVIKAVSS